jgi:hypothetical protein
MSRFGCPVDDPGQDVGELGERIDVVELAGLDQGDDDNPLFSTAVGSGEQRILATELASARGRSGLRRLA